MSEEMKYCCEDSKDIEGNGTILDKLTEAAGYTVYNSIEGCECEENLKREEIRQSIHLNPEVDTTKAEVDGYGEIND